MIETSGHLPECETSYADGAPCTCFWLRKAYQRGYRNGYNAHAEAALIAQAIYGGRP